MREFNSAAELIANYKQVRARMRALRAPTPPPAPIAAPPPVKIAPPPVKPPSPSVEIPRSGLIVYVDAFGRRDPITPSILRAIEADYDLSPNALKCAIRTNKLVEPRHIAYYLLRELVGASSTRIGRLLNRDHSTVIHGWQRARERMQRDADFAQRVATIAQRFEQESRP